LSYSPAPALPAVAVMTLPSAPGSRSSCQRRGRRDAELRQPGDACRFNTTAATRLHQGNAAESAARHIGATVGPSRPGVGRGTLPPPECVGRPSPRQQPEKPERPRHNCGDQQPAPGIAHFDAPGAAPDGPRRAPSPPARQAENVHRVKLRRVTVPRSTDAPPAHPIRPRPRLELSLRNVPSAQSRHPSCNTYLCQARTRPPSDPPARLYRMSSRKCQTPGRCRRIAARPSHPTLCRGRERHHACCAFPDPRTSSPDGIVAVAATSTRLSAARLSPGHLPVAGPRPAAALFCRPSGRCSTSRGCTSRAACAPRAGKSHCGSAMTARSAVIARAPTRHAGTGRHVDHASIIEPTHACTAGVVTASKHGAAIARGRLYGVDVDGAFAAESMSSANRTPRSWRCAPRRPPARPASTDRHPGAHAAHGAPRRAGHPARRVPRAPAVNPGARAGLVRRG